MKMKAIKQAEERLIKLKVIPDIEKQAQIQKDFEKMGESGYEITSAKEDNLLLNYGDDNKMYIDLEYHSETKWFNTDYTLDELLELPIDQLQTIMKEWRENK